MIARARDFTLQCVAVSIITWPFFEWTSLPVAPTGLVIGAVVGVGNGLRWMKERHRPLGDKTGPDQRSGA